MTQTTDPATPEPALPPRVQRKRASTALVLSVIVFVSGVGVGWGLTRMFHPRPPAEAALRPDPPLEPMVAHLREELLLTDEQTHKVKEIYQSRFDALKKIRDEMAPRMNSEYDQLRQNMKGVLSSAQFERWGQRFDSVRGRMLPPPRREQGPMGDQLRERPRGEPGQELPPPPPDGPDGPREGPGNGRPPRFGPPGELPPRDGPPRDGPRNGPPPPPPG